jgi:methionyl-tRNA formyltransferase
MRVVFMGSPEFAVPALRALIEHHEVALVVTQPDKRAGRGKKLSPPPVKVVAADAGIPVIQPTSARAPEVAEQLRATGAELGVVVAYGKILPRAVLDAFPRGCLNIHGSLLPKYRGAAPIQWAVIDGERETGVCIMQLDEGMDTGPVLLERRIEIGPRDTAGDLFERLAPLGADALLEAIAGLEAGTLEATPQDDAGASHARMLRKEDGAVDWSQPAAAVAGRIRGVDPWPGAFAVLPGGDRLKLFGAVVTDGAGAPGEVLSVDDRGLVVACGDGAVAVAEVQAAGKKRMTAEAFASGRALPVGARLGQGGA